VVDPLDEEQAIMEEREREPSVIPGDVLSEPIEALCTHPAISLPSTADVRTAIATMQERGIGSVLVVDGDSLSGIVTERDVLTTVAGHEGDMLDRPITETLRAGDTLVFLMNKMHVGGFRHVPIVDDDGVPRHVISLRDVLRYLIDHFGAEVVNLPLEPYRGEPKRYSG